MYIIAEVIWWLMLAFGCSAAALGTVLIVKKIQDINSLNQTKEDQTDVLEMVKTFGTQVEDKYYETRKRYSYDEDDLKMIISKISDKVPDEI